MKQIVEGFYQDVGHILSEDAITQLNNFLEKNPNYEIHNVAVIPGNGFVKYGLVVTFNIKEL